MLPLLILIIKLDYFKFFIYQRDTFQYSETMEKFQYSEIIFSSQKCCSICLVNICKPTYSCCLLISAPHPSAYIDHAGGKLGVLPFKGTRSLLARLTNQRRAHTPRDHMHAARLA